MHVIQCVNRSVLAQAKTEQDMSKAVMAMTKALDERAARVTDDTATSPSALAVWLDGAPGRVELLSRHRRSGGDPLQL